MAANKNDFQIKMQNLENLLSQYKNSYPRNTSEILTNSVPMILIILALLLFGSFFTLNFVLIIMSCLASPVLLIFGIILRVRLRKQISTNTASNKNIITEINSKKQELQSEFGEFPDVKEYIKKLDEEIIAAQKHKRKIKRNYRLGFALILATIVVSSICLMVINMKDISTDYKNLSIYKYNEILGIEEEEPLITLKPYDTNIGDEYTIETQNLDFFYKDVSDIHLISKEIKIAGACEDDVFRMWIVDSEGNIFGRSPKFEFKYGEAPINSYPLCHYSETDKDNKFVALGILTNLHENAGKLKFKIEKVK